MGLSEADAASIVAVLQQSWPNHPWQPNSHKAYLVGLGDLPNEIVNEAVATAIRTRTFCPVPAELRAIALEGMTNAVPSVDQAWAEVTGQLAALWPHQTPEFSHPLIAQAVKIIGWRVLSESERPGVERKQFFDTYGRLRDSAVRQITLDPLGAGTPEPTPIAGWQRVKEIAR